MLRPWLLLTPALAGVAAAQSVPLVMQGDSIPGAGAVVDVFDVAVNDEGDWIALVFTDSGATVALKNGSVLLKTGDPLSAPGFQFLHADHVHLNDAGEAAWVVYPTAGNPAVAFEAVPVAAVGDPVTAPGITPGTFYKQFNSTHINAQRQIAVSGTIDDPAIPFISDHAILRLQVDAAGALVSSTAVVKEGDVLAGTSSPVSILAHLLQANVVINDAGDVMYVAELQDGARVIARNQTALAMPGEQSPVFGRLWTGFSTATFDHNDAGDYAFLAGLTGSFSQNAMIAWNDTKFVQEGDPLKAIAPYALREAGSLANSPLYLTDDSRILWHGEWTSPDADRDSGFFINHDLVLQEGVSLAGGVPLDEFGTAELPFEASDNGRHLIYTGVRADGLKGAFLLHLEPEVTPYSGCSPNAAVLSSLIPVPTLGQGFVLTLGDGQAPGVVGFVALSTALPAGFPCGIPFGGAGELLIDVVPPNPVIVLGPTPWPGPGLPPGFPTWFVTVVPDQLPLFGLELFAQGLFVDPGGLAPGEPLRLSNGLLMRIGLPQEQ